MVRNVSSCACRLAEYVARGGGWARNSKTGAAPLAKVTAYDQLGESPIAWNSS
jgi:hypothetical protein